MKPRPARLDEIQRWMQSVIMHPGGVTEGLDAPEVRQQLDVPAAELESVICRSRAQPSDQRLEIYVNAYYERLLECLREEFAATRAAVGAELFDALAFGYLQHSPSRSYTLNQLGGGFPAYLAETRLHAHDLPPGAGPSWPEFVVELAGFEQVQREVFDGPGTERGGTLDAAALDRLPAERWDTLQLKLAPCLRLVRLAHPVHEHWQAWRDGLDPPPPAPRLTHLAVHRRDYAVERHELSAPQFRLLQALADGRTLGEAIAAAAATLEPAQLPTLVEQLRGWFSHWSGAQFFVDVSPA